MKYNWSIIGHDKQLKMIERDIASGNLAHAYLLVGPNSIGKYTVAKKMAGILQCSKDFCHECRDCVQVLKGSHVDTIELCDNKESLKIAEVRKLVERLSMTRQGKYKILLIQSVERMTTAAANSFLKTLEEPGENTIFIMTTNNVREVLPTIISRVRMIKFSHVPPSFLKRKIGELYPDTEGETLDRVSVFSLGKTGKAVHLMESPEDLAEHLKVYHDVQNILHYRNLAERFLYVEDISTDKKRIELFFSMLTHVLRSKMLEGEEGNHVNNLLKIQEAGMLLKRNVNTRLVLENLMLAL